MHRLMLAAALFSLTAPAFALDVRVPTKTTAHADVPVDQTGTPLFTPANPGKVEVTNPTPPAPPTPAIFTVYGSTTCPTGASLLFVGSVLVWNAYPGNDLLDGQCWQSVPPAYTGRYGPVDPRPLADCAVCRF